MEFLVTRTSGWDDKKPFDSDKLYQKYFDKIDARRVDDPQKLSFAKERNNWYKVGTNHRVENGHIKRDFPLSEIGWFMKIETLEELIDFKNKVGSDIVLTASYQNEMILEIEIYDSYRE